LALSKTTRDRILNLLKVAVTVIGLAVVLLTQDLDSVAQVLRNINWFPFLGALLLFLIGSLVRAYRWGVLVWSLGISASWRRLVALYFVGAFFSMFLLTGVGGDAVKMYELAGDSHKAAASISSVLVDRFLGLFVLFAIALIALMGAYEVVSPEVRILIAVVFIACLVGVALLLQRTWIESLGRRLRLDQLLSRIKILRELYESIHMYSMQALLQATAASVVWNLILILGYFLLALSVGIELSLWYYFLFVPIISVVLLVPSVGGLGIRDGATVLLFTRVGVGEAQALALALAYDLTLLIIGLIGGTIYLIQGMREARA
jgi:uncharacterized protein (TIRG00374 family)